ncbi:MAG: fatty acid oxidation complex subunit alpha FadB [Porticoccaceae bacterium]
MYLGNTLSLIGLENGFVELNFNNASAPVNKFDQQTLGELSEALEKLSTTPEVRGLLLSSSKSSFIVGADISEFNTLFAMTEEQFIESVQSVNRLLSKLEDFAFPSVAAINGHAMGGGLEICLACDARVITTEAVVGLPETGLGILPGWGGTVRLPRLSGFKTALAWITSGAQHSSEKALEQGVVDAVVDSDQLREQSLDLLEQMATGQRDFTVSRQAKLAEVSIPSADREQITTDYREAITAKSGSHYPAPLAVVDLMHKSSQLTRDAALELEALTFYKLSQTPQARALIGLFTGEQYVSKCAKNALLKLDQEPLKIKTGGVIGAGIMGGGIAYQNAISGFPIVMKDIAQAALDTGIAQADKLLNKSVARGKLDEFEAQRTLEMITPSLDDQDLTRCDMVIEAVVEQQAVKQMVLSALENQLQPGAIIASNTSTISINQLASELQRPEQFCGMHFFNPVNAMKLVEVIRAEKTADSTIAAVCDYALKLGKKPVVVNDCPGFLVNRVLFAMCLGMEMLLRDGVDFQQIDSVMEAWGMPMGPAYLIDVIGLDTVFHCYSVMMDGIPQRFTRHPDGWPTELLFKEDRLGQKNSLGYYQYQRSDTGRTVRAPDPQVKKMLQSMTPPVSDINSQEIIDRLLLPLAMEMAHCLEEGVVDSPTEADMALIWGIGFPAFRGGICRWMDEQGLDSICQRAEQYTELSEIYRPTENLRNMALANQLFYP